MLELKTSVLQNLNSISHRLIIMVKKTDFVTHIALIFKTAIIILNKMLNFKKSM